MASLKDIRRRISSVKSTRQITRAMKLVAAAKLRRAQEAIVSARPYAYRIYAILLGLAEKGASHPLLEVREEKHVKLVILAGDRGLCGSFNASIMKAAQKFIDERKALGQEVSAEFIGKKAFEYFKSDFTDAPYHKGLLGDARYQSVSEVALGVMNGYAEGKFDAIYLVYNEFKSAISQKVTVERFIPVGVEIPDAVKKFRAEAKESLIEPIYEPSREAILMEIVPRHFKTQLYRAVLESVASEHGARMSAMESATKNASEMIDQLTLQYNKARQAGITKELMEIVGGVEAMR